LLIFREFKIRLERSFDPDAGGVELFAQEITGRFSTWFRTACGNKNNTGAGQ